MSLFWISQLLISCNWRCNGFGQLWRKFQYSKLYIGVQFKTDPIHEDLKYKGESHVHLNQYRLSVFFRWESLDETLKTEVQCTGSYPQAYKRSHAVCQNEQGIGPGCTGPHNSTKNTWT